MGRMTELPSFFQVLWVVEALIFTMMDFNIPGTSQVFVYDDCGFRNFETFIVKSGAVSPISVLLNSGNIRWIFVSLERNDCRSVPCRVRCFYVHDKTKLDKLHIFIWTFAIRWINHFSILGAVSQWLKQIKVFLVHLLLSSILGTSCRVRYSVSWCAR